MVRQRKAEIIARATEALDPGEARAAEALVIDRAGWLTPGGLRAAIRRAVMEVAPAKARKRREQAARHARVQRWAEDSGNAALAGRELPPAAVLAANQRITAWARELKRAGLDGDMDELRARAYLDILLDRTPAPPRTPSAGRTAPDRRIRAAAARDKAARDKAARQMADRDRADPAGQEGRGPARCRPGSPGGSTSSPHW